MSTRERLTLAAAFAVALGAAAMEPLYSDLLWLPRVLGAIAAMAVVSLICRRFSVPAVLQPLASLAALAEFVSLAFARSTTTWGLIPTGRTVTALRELIDEGLTDVSRLAPPVPTHPGLTLLAVLGIAAVAIAVDVFAVLLGRAALAGLPLLVLFAVPSAVRPGGVGWLPFTLGAAGWLALLLVEGGDRVGRWGTPLKAARPNRGAVYEDTSLGRVGRRIGAAALGVAVVVPAMIPGLDARLLGGGGGGEGFGEGGSRTTTTYNPITRLRADLTLPKPRLILTYTTTDSSPDYLRMTTLDQFADAGWSASKLTGSVKRDGVKKELERPIGLTSADTREVSTRISIKTLDAQWLPAPFPPKKVNVSGPWLYDRRSETIFGIRTGTKKLKKSYTVTATRVLPDRELIDSLEVAGLPDDIEPYAAVPVVVTSVRKATEDAVGGATTAFGKVAAIQRWFRDPKNAFEYSTSSQVPGIESQSALADFLIYRRGFCEQYASAMAAMIRVAGVPARVAVGFTPGDRQPDGSYRVTTDHAHAWPEAWFAGAGWVRFEPTPRDETPVPAYAVSGAPGPTADNSDDPLGPEADDAGAQGTDTDAVDDKLDRLDPDTGLPVDTEEPVEDTASLPSLWLVGLIAALVLAVLPALLHALRGRRRWAAQPGPLVAWQQLHDDATDVGHAWRPADSPRAAASDLATARALDPPARAALERLALATERARYARDPGDQEGLRADAALVRAALLAGARPRVRWQARLMPRSTLRWAASTTGTFVADVLDRSDELWAGVRRRMHLPGTA